MKIKCVKCGLVSGCCPKCGGDIRIVTDKDECPCHVLRSNIELAAEGKLPSGGSISVTGTGMGPSGEVYTCMSCGKQHVIPRTEDGKKKVTS